MLAPLNELLRKETRWHWGKEQIQEFHKSKEFLKSSRLLVHFDSQEELTLACDAPQYGLGAVLRIEWMIAQSTQLGMLLGHFPMRKVTIPS